MAGFILHLYFVARSWIGAPDGQFYDIPAFVAHDGSWQVLIALLGISVSGGMFVVPLYAFLTTTVNKSETARTVAANNVVNSGARSEEHTYELKSLLRNSYAVLCLKQTK